MLGPLIKHYLRICMSRLMKVWWAVIKSLPWGLITNSEMGFYMETAVSQPNFCISLWNVKHVVIHLICTGEFSWPKKENVLSIFFFFFQNKNVNSASSSSWLLYHDYSMYPILNRFYSKCLGIHLPIKWLYVIHPLLLCCTGDRYVRKAQKVSALVS